MVIVLVMVVVGGVLGAWLGDCGGNEDGVGIGGEGGECKSDDLVYMFFFLSISNYVSCMDVCICVYVCALFRITMCLIFVHVRGYSLSYTMLRSAS